MIKCSDEKTKGFLVVLIITIVTGCTPGPLPPPLFPGLFSVGSIWLLVGLSIWIGILLWKKIGLEKTSRKDYLTDSLNALSERVNSLEERINRLEKRQDQNNTLN